MKKLLAKIAVFVSVMAVAVGISTVAASASVVYKLSEGLTSGLTMQNNTYLGTGDYFTVVTGGNSLIIDENDRYYIADKDGTIRDIVNDLDGKTFGFRLKTNGRGSKESRCVSFTTAGPATLELYAVTGSSSHPERYLTIVNSEGTIISGETEKICTGSNTDTYGGKTVGVARKAVVELETADTYYVYCEDGSFSIYDMIVTDQGTDSIIYWPLAKDADASVTSPYPDPTAEEKISAGNQLVDSGSGLVENKTIHDGLTNNAARIRLGKDAYEQLGATEATIGNNGFITFDYDGSLQGKSNFKVNVLAASTGTTSSRNIYIGYFDDTKEGDERFTEIGSGVAVGTSGTNIVYTVPVTEPGFKTYAIYVKPYDKGNDNTMDPEENTDIRGISLLYDGGYYTTPSITLDEPVVNGSELTVTGHFNDFSGDAFEVDKIWISAATGESTQEAAVWHGSREDEVNQVIYLTDDGDGTASFTAVFTEKGAGIIPGEDVKLQAHATYNIPDEPNDDVSYIDPAEIVSNSVRYYSNK